MFISVKSRVQTIDKHISYMNANMDMLEGKLDNPNGYSKNYILAVISGQCYRLHNMMDELRRVSTNKKLIAQYTEKEDAVCNRFDTIDNTIEVED